MNTFSPQDGLHFGKDRHNPQWFDQSENADKKGVKRLQAREQLASLQSIGEGARDGLIEMGFEMIRTYGWTVDDLRTYLPASAALLEEETA